MKFLWKVLIVFCMIFSRYVLKFPKITFGWQFLQLRSAISSLTSDEKCELKYRTSICSVTCLEFFSLLNCVNQMFSWKKSGRVELKFCKDQNFSLKQSPFTFNQLISMKIRQFTMCHMATSTQETRFPLWATKNKKNCWKL